MVILIILRLSSVASSQTYATVPVTGFNADVIANGATFTGAVTADVDGAGYYFLNQSFTAFGAPTFYLPSSGLINSAATSGLSFQLADASVNNSLRIIAQNASGTLNLVAPRTAGALYLLATSGSGAATIDVTINFSDASTQVFTGISISDWYGGANFAIQGIGRTNSVALDNGGGGTNPRLYQLTLPLNATNYLRQIQSIMVTRTSTGGYVQVMAVSANASCAVPAVQPTALSLTTISTSQIDGSFTAASPVADAYLVVRYPAGATPALPANGTLYTAGATLGSGVVVQSGTATAFNATGLTGNTNYDFYVYSYNTTNCVGPIYNTISALAGTKATNACSGPGGLITVGPTAMYPTLTAAMAALSGGISSPVLIELQSDYTSAGETFPIAIGYNACFSPAQPLTIRPAAGANGLVISSNNAGPTIDFSGANYVTIDGRPGGIGSSIAVTAAGNTNTTQLNIINSNTAGVSIRLDNGASNNVIKYCDLQGQNTVGANVPATLAGVVYIGNNGANGNDNNTIDHCNIHSTGTNAVPSIGIYSLGAINNGLNTNFNDNDTISACNVYDYFLAGGNSCGIELNQGVNQWTIKDNSLFQTSTRTYTASGYNRGIWIIPNRNSGSVGNGFMVTGNYIGGSQPLCAGAPYVLTAQGNVFDGIRLEIADGAVANASSVQGNIIANMSITTTTTSDPFHGIAITNANGNVNVGTVSGNIVGSTTATGSITIAAASGAHTIVYFFAGAASTSNPVYNMANNTAAGITLTNAGNFLSLVFNNNNYGVLNINNNVLGGDLANSISLSNTGTASSWIKAINITSGTGTSNISNNRIANLSNASLATGATICQVTGVAISGTGVSTTIRIPTITGNTIKNLYNASAVTGAGASATVIGIAMNSTFALACNLSNNTIDSLVSAGNAAVNVTGIYFNGSGAVSHTIYKNFVHSLDASGNNTNAILSGLIVNAGTGTIANNMIRMGIKPDGSNITTALTINGILSATTAANNFYHNSVYTGGTGVGTTASNTYAFRRSATSGTYDIRNNIFVNNRSNTTTGGKHYSIYFATSNTGATTNYNVYQYNGTGGIFAFNGSTDIAYYNTGSTTPGWIGADINSITGDPNFINVSGNASTVNLHINTVGTTVAEGTGAAIAVITDDYDNETRSALTPSDIGADAGNFTLAAICTTPAAPTALVLTAVSPTRIDGSFTASAGGANGYIVVRYFVGSTPVAPADGTFYTIGSALGSGTVVAIGAATSFSSTGLVANTAYDFYVYGYNNNCLGPVKYSMGTSGSQTTVNCSGPNGVLTVGPTGAYPTLTAALASLTSGISGPVIVELQNNYTSAGETFPITISANSCFSPSNTVMIRPAANANGLVITGSNAGPTIDFSGGNYVTIDGRPGSTGSSIAVTAAGSLNTVNLNIVNTNAGGAAIRFDNGASRNVVKYCDLQGQNTVGANVPATLAGVVYFGNNGAAGNDGNLIDRNNIHSTGAAVPSIGVYSWGATNTGINPNFNDADTVSNNNIYDYFLANGNSCGIELNQGVNAWVINGNSFFQTVARTFTAAGYNRAIWAIPNRSAGSSAGNGFIITNNYIGGSAPQCGGTVYSLSAMSNTFGAIRLEIADGPVVNASSVQGNTIANIAITSTSTGDVFHGIAVTGSIGNVNIGTVTGNTIGAATGNDAIVISAGSGSHSIPVFISNSAGGASVINVKNNIVGGITLTNAGSNFSGIFDNQAGIVNIDKNTIGSLVTPNSINSSNTAATSQFLRAINIPSGAGVFTITNNNIANLTNSTTSTASGSQVAGISIASAAATVSGINGNTIRDLSCATASTAGGVNSALLGIGMAATTASPVVVSGNTIHSLNSDAATAGVYLEGIFFWGSTSAAVTNTIAKNFVHSFNLSNAGNASANIRGIENNQGRAIILNNMVRLGVKPDGSNLGNAVRIDGIMKGTSLNNHILYNSVYIGGTDDGSTTSISSVFRKETTTGLDTVKNNIFINSRSTTAAAGVHYAICVNAATGVVYNNNIYRYNGTGAAFASTNGLVTTPTNATYTPGWMADDLNSLVADPVFIDATGSAATVNLHISTSVFSPANGVAATNALVTDDIDGEARSVLTPDIGADEFTQVNGIDMQAITLVSPVTALNGCYGTENVVVRVRNNSSVAIDFTVNPVTVMTNVTGVATASFSALLNTGTLAPGTTLDVPMSIPAATLDMSATGIYIFNARTIVAGDINVINDTVAATSRTRETLVAGNIASSQTSYCITSGAPILSITGANGYGSIQWQQSTTPGSGFSDINGATGSPYTIGAPITQTMYYRLVATCGANTATSAEIQVIYNNPQVTVTTPASRCDAGTVILQATGSAGTTLSWYANASGGTAIGTGPSFTTPVINVTTTYYVSAKIGSCESARTAVTATVNNSVLISSQPLSQSVCVGSAVTFSVVATGTAITYQWRKGGVNINGATAASYTISSAALTDAGSYDVVITNTCGAVTSSAATLVVGSANNWIGAVSNDWNNPGNWCGAVPTPTTDVTILAGTPFSPLISSNAAAYVRNLTISNGATVSIGPGAVLNMFGNYTNNGTLAATAGTIVFRGAMNQTVTALTAGNVTMNGTGGLVTLNGNMVVLNNLTLTNGNITLGTNTITLNNSSAGSLISHIITNGNGAVIANNITSAFTIPVGYAGTSYTPVTIGNGQGRNYMVRVTEGLSPALFNSSKAINRTWIITPSAPLSTPADISLQYGDADKNADCIPTAIMDVATHNGTAWTLVSPATGVIPTGSSGTARTVTVQTLLPGPMAVSNKGGFQYNGTSDITINLLPTLVTSDARIRAITPSATKIGWVITDVAGRVVMKFDNQLAAGQTDINLSLGHLASGIYHLAAYRSDGSKLVIRFVINH